MSTTFNRVRTASEVAATSDSFSSYGALSDAISARNPDDYRIRGDGSLVTDYMSQKSIVQLLEFAAELKLVSKAADGSIRLTQGGRRCLESDDKYRRQLRTAIKKYFEDHQLDMADIESEIKGVKLPEVPDADTIHGGIADQTDLSNDELRRALFLLAKAGGIKRITKVHYRLD